MEDNITDIDYDSVQALEELMALIIIAELGSYICVQLDW